jgi:hypothetical protein
MIEEALAKRECPDPETTKLMLSCLDNVEDAIERICPVVISKTKKGGIAICYGPEASTKGGKTFIFATAKHYIATCVDDWFTLPLPPPEAEAAAWWAHIADATNEHDPEKAITMLMGRLGEHGITLINDSCAKLEKAGATPTIVTMSFRDDKTACGATIVVPLPLNVCDQLEEAGVDLAEGLH